MKHFSILLCLVLFTLLSCSRNDSPPSSSENTPTVQANIPPYDATSTESIILNSHPEYGQMIQDAIDGGLNYGTDLAAAFDGPWVDNPHPWKPWITGYCNSLLVYCFIAVTAPSCLDPIFQSEGLVLSDYSNPAILIRVYEGHSSMALVNNFGDDPETGEHTAEKIKEL